MRMYLHLYPLLQKALDLQETHWGPNVNYNVITIDVSRYHQH